MEAEDRLIKHERLVSHNAVTNTTGDEQNTLLGSYRNDHKFADRQVRKNSVAFPLKINLHNQQESLTRLSHMRRVTRKPVFGVSDQVRLKPARAAIEAR